jgi:hypothetical protein
MNVRVNGQKAGYHWVELRDGRRSINSPKAFHFPEHNRGDPSQI